MKKILFTCDKHLATDMMLEVSKIPSRWEGLWVYRVEGSFMPCSFEWDTPTFQDVSSYLISIICDDSMVDEVVLAIKLKHEDNDAHIEILDVNLV